MALDISSLLKGQAPRSQGDAMPANNEVAQGPALSTVAREMAELRAASVPLPRRGFQRLLTPAGLLSHLKNAGPSVLIGSALAILLMSAIWFARQKPYTAPETAAVTTPQSTVVSAPAIRTTPAATVPLIKTLPVAAHSKRAKQPAVASAQVPKSPAETSLLQLHLQHHLRAGTVSVWSDGRLLYTHEIRGETTKKLVLFRGVEGLNSADLHVPTGEHTLRVRVQSEDNSYDQSAEIGAKVRKDAEQVLTVKCDRQRLSLTMQ
jgi:hypothetical protein